MNGLDSTDVSGLGISHCFLSPTYGNSSAGKAATSMRKLDLEKIKCRRFQLTLPKRKLKETTPHLNRK